MQFRREPLVYGAGLRGRCARAVCVWAALVTCSAAAAPSAPSPSSPPAASVDVLGEVVPAPDPAKAFLHLDQIPPPVTSPLPKAAPPELSERAQRAVNRAAELRAEKRFTEATIELEKALRFDPDHPLVHRALALVRWDAGEFDRARTHLDAALAGRPNDIICHYLAGRLAARRFENAAAILALRTALACPADAAAQPFRRLTQFHLAELLSTEGYYSAASEAYTAYLEGVEVPAPKESSSEQAELERLGAEAAYAGLARVSAALGDYAGAARQFRQAYSPRTTPMDPARRLEYARLLARAGELDAAIAEARAVLPDDPAAVPLLEKLYAAGKQPASTLEDLQQAVAAQPESVGLAQAYVNALQKAGRLDEAAVFLQTRLTDHPEQSEWAVALFEMHRSQQNWLAAFEALVAAVRVRPDFASDVAGSVAQLASEPAAVQAILNGAPATAPSADFAETYLKGALALQAKDSPRAETWLEAAVKASPEFTPARVALGEAYVQRYAWDQAIRVAAPEDLKISPDSRLEFVLGEAYTGLEEHAKAQVHYNSAIRLDRANVDAMLALALLYLETNEPVRARQQLDALVRVDPQHERGREMLFRAFLTDSDPRAAADQLEELRRNGASATTIARCVAWLEFNPTAPDHARLRQTLNDAMAASEPDAETLYMVALSHQLEGQPEEAIPILQRALALNPRHDDSAELLAIVYQRVLDFDAALAQRRTLLERRPHRESWKRDQLNLLLILQHWDEAIAYAETLLADEKVDEQIKPVIRTELIRTYHLGGRKDAAIAALQAWYKEEPEDGQVYVWLLAMLQDAKRHDEALELIRRWPEVIPDSFDSAAAEPIWGRLPAEHRTEVEQLILTQVLAEPEDKGLQAGLVGFLRATKRFDAALVLARSNGAESGDSKSFAFEIYLTLKAAGRTDEAIDQLTQMLGDLTPRGLSVTVTPLDFQLELAQLLIGAARYDKARDRINKWLEGAEDDAEKLVYLRVLTLCEQEAGRLDEAVQALNLALELDPEDVGTHNDLGYTLADLGREIARADELVRFAVAAEPRNSAYLDSLGWVKYKEGDFAAALKWLRLARYAGTGEDPTVCDHLGDACWKLGDKDEARKYWTEAVSFAEERLAEVPESVLYGRTLAAVKAKLEAVAAGEEPQVATPVKD